MTKLFSQFLIEHKAVNAEQMVDAMLTQIGKTQTIAEWIHEQKLIPVDSFLTVLHHQMEAGCDFRSAAIAKGLWSDEIASRCKEHTIKTQTPLAEILVQKNYIKLEDLTHHLDSYLQEAPSGKNTPQPAPQAAQATPPAPTTLQMTSEAVEEPAPPASESLAPPPTQANAPVVSAINSAPYLSEEYSRIYTNEFKPTATILIDNFSQAKEASPNELNFLIRCYSELSAAAEFIKAKFSKQVTEHTLTILARVVDSQNGISDSAILGGLLKESLTLLEDLHQNLVTSHSELGGLSDTDWTEKISSLGSSYEQYLQTLGKKDL